jgi:leader peptidase (prepilin peptidase)/N-methyltransferase
MMEAAIGAGLGLIAGSFLGAIVTRWPRGSSVLRGRSQCDACGRTLGPLDLVPLLSWLLARGRCRSCAVPIDPAHVLMETGCALIGTVAFLIAPPVPAIILALGGWILLALALLDWWHHWLPDALTLPFAIIGLTLGEWAGLPLFTDRAIGAALGYGGLFLIAFAYRALRGREGLGLGDAKLLGGIGGWLGWAALPIVLLVASVSGLLWAGIASLRGQAVTGQTALPLGTFLCLAVVPAAWIAAMLGLF